MFSVLGVLAESLGWGVHWTLVLWWDVDSPPAHVHWCICCMFHTLSQTEHGSLTHSKECRLCMQIKTHMNKHILILLLKIKYSCIGFAKPEKPWPLWLYYYYYYYYCHKSSQQEHLLISKSNLYAYTLPFKNFLMSLKEVSYAHQACIYLIKNTIKTVILWTHHNLHELF